MRPSVQAELRVGEFLLRTGGFKCAAVANNLGISISILPVIVRAVSNSICDRFRKELILPSTAQKFLYEHRYF